MNKTFPTIEDKIADIKDGTVVGIGGFFAAGVPRAPIDGLTKKRTRDLTIRCGSGPLLDAYRELDQLVADRQIKERQPRTSITSWQQPPPPPSQKWRTSVGDTDGSMDLGSRRQEALYCHGAYTNTGAFNLVKELTCHATAIKKVRKILVDLAGIEVIGMALLLKEIYPELSPEKLQSVTEPKLIIAADLKEIEL